MFLGVLIPLHPSPRGSNKWDAVKEQRQKAHVAAVVHDDEREAGKAEDQDRDVTGEPDEFGLLLERSQVLAGTQHVAVHEEGDEADKQPAHVVVDRDAEEGAAVRPVPAADAGHDGVRVEVQRR